MDNLQKAAYESHMQQAKSALRAAVNHLEAAREVLPKEARIQVRALSVAITHAETAKLWQTEGGLLVP